ncbi:MAG: hypothetical protein HY900_23855 [Deltaproteobacteria bacterium]|nr:hypothetical protein [Deltaproteobacteria bacterium]
MSAGQRGGRPSLDSWREAFDRILPGHVRRVLVLTAGYGAGHNQAAKALRRLLGELRQEVDVRVLDMLAAPAGRERVRQLERYYACIRCFPRAYHTTYRTLARIPGVLSFLSRPYWSPSLSAFEELGPDVIFATHVYGARIAERLKAREPKFVTAGIAGGGSPSGTPRRSTPGFVRRESSGRGGLSRSPFCRSGGLGRYRDPPAAPILPELPQCSSSNSPSWFSATAVRSRPNPPVCVLDCHPSKASRGQMQHAEADSGSQESPRQHVRRVVDAETYPGEADHHGRRKEESARSGNGLGEDAPGRKGRHRVARRE